MRAQETLVQADALMMWVEQHDAFTSVHLCVGHHLVTVCQPNSCRCIVDRALQPLPLRIYD